MKKIGFLAALVLGLSACGSDGDSSQPTVTCDWVADSADCSQVSGPLDQSMIDDLGVECTGMGGTYSTSATCPGTNLIGYCRYSDSGFTIDYFYYSVPAGYWDAPSAAADCAFMPGATWHPAS